MLAFLFGNRETVPSRPVTEVRLPKLVPSWHPDPESERIRKEEHVVSNWDYRRYLIAHGVDMQRAASVQKDHAPYLYRSVFVPPINPVSDLKEAFLKEQIQQSRKVAPVVVMPFRK
jgi:hypothetical protein